MGVGLEIIANFGHSRQSNSKLISDLENSTSAIENLLIKLGFTDRKHKKKRKGKNRCLQWIQCDNIGELKVFRLSNSDLWIELHLETCSINFGMSWLIFIREPKIREAIRSLTKQIVLTCGGTRAIYMPDIQFVPSCNAGNAFHEGSSFEEIEKVLIRSVLDQGSFMHRPTELDKVTKSRFQEWTYEPFPFLIDVF